MCNLVTGSESYTGMLCAVNTPHWGGRGREQEREKGQSHWAERGWSLHALRNTHAHTPAAAAAGRYVAAAPTGRDFYRGSGTNAGLAAVLGCSKAGSHLILSGGGVTPGDVWSVGGEFPDSGKE